MISLKGDHSNLVAQKISKIRGITCVSLVTGSIDILCACLFRETADLFKIIETIKTIENVDKVSWAEEVSNIPSIEITALNFQDSINTSVQDNNTNDSSHKETAA
ncbi:MAG: Lrp/AsnC ligand binding domain-containing protein [Candidatus Nitrosopolaris sp.]